MTRSRHKASIKPFYKYSTYIVHSQLLAHPRLYNYYNTQTRLCTCTYVLTSMYQNHRKDYKSIPIST
jgi:hypothetical protein